MTSRTRAHRASESGLSLIELIVTMGLLMLGVLAMLGLFATIVITIRSTDSDAQLAVQVRQVQDYIESESFAYIPCASSAGGYDSALQTARLSGSLTVPASYAVHVIGVQQASGGSHTVAGTPGLGLSASYGCPGDYGVQQLELRVSDSSHSVKRLVYIRWNSM